MGSIPSLAVTNVRPTNLVGNDGVAAFGGVTIGYQYRFRPKLPCLFAEATAAHFPALDYNLGERLLVHDPFGRLPMLQVGGILAGVRQDLRQRGKVQPYLELGGGAYLAVRHYQPLRALPGTFTNFMLGGLGGLGVRCIPSQHISLGICTRLQVIASIPYPLAFSYFEWGGFVGFTL
jgi:hypothetical protein